MIGLCDVRLIGVGVDGVFFGIGFRICFFGDGGCVFFFWCGL